MSTNDAIITVMSSEDTTFTEKGEKSYVISTTEIDSNSNDMQPIQRSQTGRRRGNPGDSPSEEATDADDTTLKWLGRLYLRFLNFNVITRSFVYLVPVALVLAIPMILFATVYSDAEAGDSGIRLFGIFAWLQTLWVGFWVTRLFSIAIPHIFQFFCSMVLTGTRKWTELLRSLKLPISLVIWAIFAWATVPLITHYNMLHKPSMVDEHNWTYTLRKVLLATIPVTCIWFLEKLMIRLVAVEYHQKQFQRKIKEFSHLVDILTQLYAASTQLFPRFCRDFDEIDLMVQNSIVGNTHVGKIGNVQARAVFGGLARLSSGVTSAFTSFASELTGGFAVDPESDKGIVIGALQKACSAKALAQRLWMSLAEDGKTALYESDIRRALGKDREHDAEMIFRDLDKDRNGDVSLEEMELMLVDFERSQKAMFRGMNDVKSAVAALDRILMVGALVLTAGTYAAFFSQHFLKNLAVATTSIMSFSFAFAGTVQEFAGSCIFIFVKHPYDIDDRVEIGGISMIVKHISLLYTVFHRIDTNRTVQIPNIVNNGNWIENVTRSGAMRERITISIDAGTSLEDIETFHRELKAFVLDPENKRDFMPEVSVDVEAIGDFKSLQLTIEYTHKSNWSNEQLRLLRRTKFLTAVITNLRQVPIYAPGTACPALGEKAAPSYSVAITDSEAAAAKTQLDTSRRAAKLVNKRKYEPHDIDTFAAQMDDVHVGRRPSTPSLDTPTDGNYSEIHRRARYKKQSLASCQEDTM